MKRGRARRGGRWLMTAALGAALLHAAPAVAAESSTPETSPPTGAVESPPAKPETPAAPSAETQPNATPAVPPAAAPAEPATATPTDVENVPAEEVTGILGKKVFGVNGENMGLMVDVIVDRDGRPLAAVVDFGGFLGVGSRKIAIDWRLLQFHPGDDKTPIVLGLDRAALKAAPEFKPAMKPVAIVVAAPPPDPTDPVK